MKLRIKFRKYGPVRFIGHLDVMRFFQKALRRAGIDVAYTSGYSPHQIMSFAAPLGVGLTSNGEYMDIEVHSLPAESGGLLEVKNRLNRASVPGIEITGVTLLPDKAENAMASVAAASYTVVFRPGKEPKCNLETAIPAFMAKKSVLLTKEGKKGPREVDIRPGIYEFTLTNSALHMLLDASSGRNIKPVQVIDALLSENGEKLPEHGLLVNREDTFMNTGTEENPIFVPLDCIKSTEENT